MKNNGVKKLFTGIVGLDEILNGGLATSNAYLVRGNGGTGNTIMGFQTQASLSGSDYLIQVSGCGQLSLLKFLSQNNATVMLTSESGFEISDEDLQVRVDDIITFMDSKEFRNLSIQRMRGTSVLEGDHSYRITEAGMVKTQFLKPHRDASIRFFKFHTFRLEENGYHQTL